MGRPVRVKNEEFWGIISQEVNLKKRDAKLATETFFKALEYFVVTCGNQVHLPGIGTLQKTVKPARKGRNPKTNTEIDIPEKTIVKLKPKVL